ncbi:MAG TPA: hypothetical protein DDY13_04395 [Cytophagales bacterium]|jgi:hypothetical protein|nr:hypothetical protein [Cytophagales bacterium]
MSNKMKNLTYILFAFALASMFSSCDKEGEKVFIAKTPTSPLYQAPEDPGGLEFTKDQADESIKFAWTASDFGFQASITYQIQIAKINSFEERATILTTQELSGNVKVSDINGVLLGWDLPIGESSTVFSRVLAAVNSNVEPVISDVKEFTVTPYETLVDYPMIYLPGAYQEWSPGAEIGRLYSYEFNTVYEGIIRIVETENNNGEFKVTPAPNWNNAWGGSLTQSGSNYSGTLDPSGGNYVVEPGVYALTVDTEALTIELKKTNDWGIIGNAIPPYDWSVDIDMIYNGQRQMWEVTGDFEAGDFKFRANDGWDLNYGDSGADGSLDQGGDNIVLAAGGNYTIRFDELNLTYQIIEN